jgi:hypothetical protein
VRERGLVVASVLERQPQFRRAHSAGCARELPGVAAACRRLCAGGIDEHRPASEPLGTRYGRPAGLSEGYLAVGEGYSAGDACTASPPMRSAESTPRVRRRCPLAGAAGADRRSICTGSRIRPTCAGRHSSKA